MQAEARNRCCIYSRADEAERRHIAELGVWRGFGAPEPWRQRLNVSAGGQGDEWERIRSEVLREVRSVRCCWASQPTAFTTQNTVPKAVRFLLTPI
jgi:hypothetical protein